MPDDKPAGAAVAEPEVPVVEAPEKEAVPVPGQEPSEEEVSGAGETEEEAPKEEGPEGEEPSRAEVLREAIKKLREDDPELAEVLRQEAGVEEKPPVDEDQVRWETESKSQRRASWSQALGWVEPYGDAAVKQFCNQWNTDLKSHLGPAAQKIGPDDNGVIQPILDVDGITSWVAQRIIEGRSAGYTVAERGAWNAVMDALEGHAAYRHLTADDRKALRDGSNKPLYERLAQVLGIFLDASARSAPEEDKRKIRKEVEEELGSTQALNKALEAIKGGKKATRRSSPSKASKTYKDMTDEERSKLTDEEIDAMTAGFASET